MAADNVDMGYFFKLAVEQYVDIDLVFMLDMCPYTSLSALCVGVKNGYFITRITLDEVDASPIIWGSEVSGFFAVRDMDLVNCNFKSRLMRIYNAPPNALFMAFPLPKTIDHGQRRFSKRVSLDEEMGADFSIWHGQMSGGDMEKPPLLSWQSLKNHGCWLAELSANGMRVDMSKDNLFYPRMFVNDPVLLRGDFGSRGKSAPIYALGSIVRKMHRPEYDDVVCIGCHFTSWRKADANGAWFRADYQEGIPAIAQWVSRNFRNVT